MSGGAAALVARAYISDDRLYSQLITRSFPSSVQIAHAGSSLPACSATMYAAYQSAHSASRCPVRFSCSPWAASARRIVAARSLADPYDRDARIDPSRQTRRDLLEQPLVAVRIPERRERAVAVALGIDAGGLTSGWLRIERYLDPLRNNPRFQKLVAGAK